MQLFRKWGARQFTAQQLSLLQWGAALIASATLALVALPTLFYPFTRDQGIYAYITDLMMHGGAPFRDAWELKPPGVYFAYWAAFLLFGRSEFAVRLFDVLYALGTSTTVYALARAALHNRRIAWVAAWLYACCYYLLVHFHSQATPEAFMTPFLIAVAYGLVRGVQDRKETWPLVLSGAGSGMVFWFKPTGGLVIAAVLLWAVWSAWHRGWRVGEVGRAVGAMALGLGLGALPIGLYLGSHGLGELLEVWRAYGTGAYLEAGGLALGNGPLAALDVLARYARDWQLWLWLALAGSLVIVAREDAHEVGWSVPVFFVSALAAALVQGKLFEYHWIPALAPLAILAAAALVWLAEEALGERAWRQSARTLFAIVAITALLLATGYDHLVRYRRMAAYLLGGMSTKSYYAQFNIGTDYSWAGTHEAAAYLRAHTAPSDTVFIWGVEPLVNWLAERRSPTRFVSFYALLRGEESNPRLGDWQREFVTDLQRERPPYIVLVKNDHTPLAPAGSFAELDALPAFRTLLDQNYIFEAQVEDYFFYRHR